MKKAKASYTMVIEKDKRTGSNEPCFTAYVPVLGIAADGDTVSDAQQAAQDLIEFHIQTLHDEGEDIPIEDKDSTVTRAEVVLPDKTAITT